MALQKGVRSRTALIDALWVVTARAVRAHPARDRQVLSPHNLPPWYSARIVSRSIVFRAGSAVRQLHMSGAHNGVVECRMSAASGTCRTCGRRGVRIRRIRPHADATPRADL
eukprot:4642950-Prymnesium_polylepis.1